MDPILLSALTGIGSSSLSAVLAWFLSKKKYYSEVDGSNIENMKKSLEFYISLSDDYKKRLDEELQSHREDVSELKKENQDLKKAIKKSENKFNSQLSAQQKEIQLMKNQMLSVYGQVCLNFACAERIKTQEPAPKATKSVKGKKVLKVTEPEYKC